MQRLLTSTLLLLVAAAVPGAATAAEPSPEGYWLTEKKQGIVQIYRCGSDMLCGKIVWFRIKPESPNPQGLDLKNPDPAQRNRSLCGLAFMSGFKPTTPPGSWEDGRIYDAESGDTYHATLQLRADGTLSLHGYIGIPLFGASEVWTRDTQPLPACPGR
jgi:uncharacterized protein (DUF2147 family)